MSWATAGSYSLDGKYIQLDDLDYDISLETALFRDLWLSYQVDGSGEV